MKYYDLPIPTKQTAKAIKQAARIRQERQRKFYSGVLLKCGGEDMIKIIIYLIMLMFQIFVFILLIKMYGEQKKYIKKLDQEITDMRHEK